MIKSNIEQVDQFYKTGITIKVITGMATTKAITTAGVKENAD
jgi:hypothetical protein